MAFVQRLINLTITLGAGDFGDAGASNTETLTGYWVDVEVTKANLPAADQATVRVWGVSQTLANTLSRLGKPLSYDRTNILTIEVGDTTSGMTLLFNGLIWTAYQDFSELPDVVLVLTCNSGVLPYTAPGAAFSYQGTIDGANVAATLAQQLGVGFVNNGVSFMLTNPYYSGSPTEQLRKLLQAIKCYANLDSTLNALVIWPRSAPNGSSQGPTIGPPGLVGYPEYSDTGVVIRALFQPGLAVGALFNLHTSITPAAGSWQTWVLKYQLSSRPDGPWFMDVGAMRPLDGTPQ